MTPFLYISVVLIWGTTWIAIFHQQGTVPISVSIFWRFALAGVTLLLVLKLSARLACLSKVDHLYCALQGFFLFGLNFLCFL